MHFDAPAILGLASATAILATGCLEGSEPVDSEPAASTYASVMAIENVSLIPMTEGPELLPGSTVLVADGKILAVGKTGEVAIPDGSRILDGTGRFLMPGLTEMHGHLAVPDDATPGALTVEATLALFVARGVTTVRSMLGHEAHLALRDEIAAGDRIGPRLIAGSPALFGTPGMTVDHAVGLVNEYAKAGYDLVKFHENLSADVYAAAALTCREQGMPFAGHVTDFIALSTALEAGQRTIDHLDNFLLQTTAEPGEVPEPRSAPHLLLPAVRLDRLPDLARATRAADVAVIPTLALFETFGSGRSGADLLAERPEVSHVPRGLREYWTRSADNRTDYYANEDLGRRWAEARRAVFRALVEADVTILCGTDSPQEFSVPGFSIAREMQAMAACGLEPARVLYSATAAPADFRGASASEGRIAPGYRADLVLLRGNPLEDLEHIGAVEAVWLAGHYLDRPSLDALLAPAPEAPSEAKPEPAQGD